MKEPSDSRRDTGPRLIEGGARFSLFSRHASNVELCLFEGDGETESRRVSLRPNGEGVWSAFVEGVGPGQLYGFRVDGPYEPWHGHRFNREKLLVDPRALAITGEPTNDPAFAGGDDSRPDLRNTGPFAPKSIVVDRRFDWHDDQPPAVPWADSVIYECHVRGMSMLHPEVDDVLRGTYAGLGSEPILDHLSALGVTAVELLPVQQIASEQPLLENGLTNFFGYSPLGFFAPHAAYANQADGDQVREFKEMVKALHRRGIEVILDVVFNHTAEGDHRGRTLSLRGIDNHTWYRLQAGDPSRYDDSTGCGNSIAADDPFVAGFLIDCLRYWVDEMHVDGFRFDLAVALGRTAGGFSGDAPFFRAVAEDPVLSGVKLIAEPWDLGPKGYQRGQFPPGWIEWDDGFRDATRRIWRGDRPEDVGVEILDLVDGGFDRLAANVDPRRSTIHFVTCHDGFTLEDLVSYEHKNNWANGEGNRDGGNHNHSSNWGIEGPTEAPEIRERRDRAKANLLATMLLSGGVPMLLYGDELGRSQGGNNNAYCQDNELTWIDWQPPEQELRLSGVISSLTAIRRAVSSLLADGGEARRWTFDGKIGDRPASAAGLWVSGSSRGLLLLFNAESRDRLVRLPRSPAGGRWTRLLSTVEPGARSLTGATYRLCARSVSVLELQLPAG